VRIAALYDIHGNLPALEAVLAEIEHEPDVDEIVAGGDVLWGPKGSDCLALLEQAGATCVSGNCEREVLHPQTDLDRRMLGALDARQQALVATWPRAVERDVDGLGRVVFCHATPRSDDEILTRVTPDGAVAAALAGVEADVVVCGHTHVQFDREAVGAPRLVNAGSVGLPYEGAPGSYWALLGPGVELRRTEYDTVGALARLRGGLPESMLPWLEATFVPALEGRVSAEEATAEFEARRGA
jgi:putative phosphoesterase